MLILVVAAVIYEVFIKMNNRPYLSTAGQFRETRFVKDLWRLGELILPALLTLLNWYVIYVGTVAIKNFQLPVLIRDIIETVFNNYHFP